MAPQDFDVDSLAAYLHLTPQQVVRLADRDKVPGRKVGGQWRFSRAEIHHWMEERMGVLDHGELDQVERLLKRQAGPEEKEVVSIADKLPLQAIAVPLMARTRAKVITAMVDLAAGTGLVWDPVKLAEAVRAREELAPTALDNGVALLHPRRPMPGVVAEPLMALGRTDAGIPFGGAGGVLTDVFFLICSTDDQRHLRVLARISRLIADGSLLEGIRAAENAAEVHRLVVEHETAITK